MPPSIAHLPPMSAGESRSIGWTMDEVLRPTMALYWNMPADAEAIFSINDAVPHPRSFGSSWPPVAGRDVAWSTSRFQIEADAIRAKFPEEARRVVRPREWHHLYRYFDVVDLWHRGAHNLARVLSILCEENEAHRTDIVSDWAYKWLTHEANRKKLSTWDQKSDVMNVLTLKDMKNVGDCGKESLDLLRGALQFWHGIYAPLAIYKRLRDAHAQAQDRVPTIIQPRATSSRLSVPIHTTPARSSSVAPGLTLPMADISGLVRHSISANSSPRLAAAAPMIVYGTVAVHHAEVPKLAQSSSSSSGNSAAVRQLTNGRQPSNAVSSPAGHSLASHVFGHDEAGTSRPSNRPQQPAYTSGPVPAGHSLASQVSRDNEVGPSRLPNHPRQSSFTSGPAPHGRFSVNRAAGNDDNAGPSRLPDAPQQPSNGSQQTPPHGSPPQHPSPSGVPVNGGYSAHPPPASPYTCKNWYKPTNAESYEPCPCMRCMNASRSVLIQHINKEGRVSSGTRRELLIGYFSRWGHVEDCAIKGGHPGRKYALLRYVCEQSARQAVTEADTNALLPISSRLRVLHPWYSRHYQYQPYQSPPRRNGSRHHRPSFGAAAFRAGGASPPSPPDSVSGHHHPINPTNPSQHQSPAGPGTPGMSRSASMAPTSQFPQPPRYPDHQNHVNGRLSAAYPPFSGPFHQQTPPPNSSMARGPPTQPYFIPHTPIGWAGHGWPGIPVIPGGPVNFPLQNHYQTPPGYPAQHGGGPQQGPPPPPHGIPSAPETQAGSPLTTQGQSGWAWDAPGYATLVNSGSGHVEDSGALSVEAGFREIAEEVVEATNESSKEPTKDPKKEPTKKQGKKPATEENMVITKPPSEESFSQDQLPNGGSASSSSRNVIGNIKVKLPNKSPEEPLATISKKKKKKAARAAQPVAPQPIAPQPIPEASNSVHPPTSSNGNKGKSPAKPSTPADNAVPKVPTNESAGPQVRESFATACAKGPMPHNRTISLTQAPKKQVFTVNDIFWKDPPPNGHKGKKPTKPATPKEDVVPEKKQEPYVGPSTSGAEDGNWPSLSPDGHKAKGSAQSVTPEENAVSEVQTTRETLVDVFKKHNYTTSSIQISKGKTQATDGKSGQKVPPNGHKGKKPATPATPATPKEDVVPEKKQAAYVAPSTSGAGDSNWPSLGFNQDKTKVPATELRESFAAAVCKTPEAHTRTTSSAQPSKGQTQAVNSNSKQGQSQNGHKTNKTPVKSATASVPEKKQATPPPQSSSENWPSLGSNGHKAKMGEQATENSGSRTSESFAAVLDKAAAHSRTTSLTKIPGKWGRAFVDGSS